MKIIVLGTNHAGTSFIKTMTQVDKEVKITAYDKNSNISFLGCGIALWVAGEFDDPAGLFYSSEEELTKRGANIKMEHEVIKVDTKKKEVLVKNLKTGEEFTDAYDKLIYAGGTWPIVPPLEGVDLKGIYLSKLFQHAQEIKKLTQDKSVKNVVVVGAGYIGIELTEAFMEAGKNITLIDGQDRVVPNYFDHEFTDPMEDRMKKSGVKLQMGEMLQKFEGKDGKVTKVVTTKGSYDADLVIMSIGFRPQTQLVKDQVELIRNGAIKVDKQMRTSVKDVYAIGDAAAYYHNALKSNENVALATNAVKGGIVAALSIAGSNIDFPGVQGTNGISVFGCHYASTGISEVTAKRLNVPNIGTSFLIDKDRPEFMKNAEDVQIKIVYDTKTFKLLGAQIGSFGQHNHSEAIFSLSLAIQKGMTLHELALLDVYFLPHYNKPFNYILQSILNAIGMNYNS